MNTNRQQKSLRSQLILGYVAVVFLTTALATVPAVWLIRTYLDRQLWLQLDQGIQTAQALYAAAQTDIANTAALTAHRPSLSTLVACGNRPALESYLSALRADTAFDLLAVCRGAEELARVAAKPFEKEPCSIKGDARFYLIDLYEVPQVWLLDWQAVSNLESEEVRVIVGRMLDQDFMLQLHRQIGYEHMLWADNTLVATSLSDDLTPPPDQQEYHTPGSGPTTQTAYYTFALNRQPFYSARFPLEGSWLQAEVVLPIADTIAIQRRLIGILAGTVLGTALLASLLVTLLARRLSRPLIQLAGAAAAMSRGDLNRPIQIEIPTQEVALVAQALERARLDLQQVLLRLQQEKDWADHLLESIVEGIVTLDSQGRIAYFSSGAERITGWQRDAVIGQSIDRIFKLAEERTPFSERIPQPGQHEKLVITLADARQATLAFTDARLAPSRAGEEAAQVLVFRDVSDEEAVHRLLGEFLGTIAHEFKTPLAALAASLELLQDQGPDLNEGELEELLTSLHLGILRLQTLVDNLLESANIEARRFRISLKPCELGSIVKEASQMMEPLLRKYGQTLRVALPEPTPLIFADHRRSIQVLVNFLSNASRHGPHDADIDLSVTLEGRFARVQIGDRGPGIPVRHRAEVFRRFVRPGLQSDNERAGAGLGLSVVKAIVEAQGGQVGVTDHPGGGSIFWFTVPLAASHESTHS